MTWILNTIVSANLRRVSLGISANVRIDARTSPNDYLEGRFCPF